MGRARASAGTVGRRPPGSSRARRLAGLATVAAAPVILAVVVLGATRDADGDPPPSAEAVEIEPAAEMLARLPGRIVIGESVEGRAIEAFTVGSGERVIVLIGGLHAGPEEETIHIVRGLLMEFRNAPWTLPADLTLVFVPKANPDGHAAGIRVNANGVDLNRNWGTQDWEPLATHSGFEVEAGEAPFSEPETQALYAFLVGLDPHIVLSYHGYLGVLDDNGVGAATALAAAYASASHYEQIEEWTEYPITGQLIQAMAEARIAAADVELEEDDDDAFERNLRGLRALIAAATES